MWAQKMLRVASKNGKNSHAEVHRTAANQVFSYFGLACLQGRSVDKPLFQINTINLETHIK